MTAVVTMVGWFIVAAMADRREFRKEVREHIKDLKVKADSARLSAHKYWLESDKRSAPACAAALKADLGSLARQIQVVSAVGIDVNASLMAQVRQQATGGNFEARNRVRSSADHDRMMDVYGAIDDLLAEVDRVFYNQFKPSRPHRFRHLLLLLALPFLARDRS